MEPLFGLLPRRPWALLLLGLVLAGAGATLLGCASGGIGGGVPAAYLPDCMDPAHHLSLQLHPCNLLVKGF